MRPRLRSSCPCFALLVLFAAPPRAADKPTEQAALPGRSRGPLPARRRLAVPARHRRPGRQAALRCAARSTSGLEHGQGPERVEPRRRRPTRRWRAGSAGTARTSSCPSADSALAWALRFESVNYRTRVWLNGTPVGENTRRLHPVRVRPRTRSSARARTGSSCAWTRSRLPTRLPARRPERRRRADRRLVELLRHPARGLPAASSTRSTSRRSRSARCIACGDLRRASVAGDDQPAQRHRPRPARRRSPASSATASVDLGTKTHRRRTGSRAFTDTLRIAKPRLWSPAEPEPLRRPLHRPRGRRARSRATRCTAASARSRSSNGQLVLNGQPHQLPRRRPARGLQGRRASRSTTRAASELVERRQGARRDGPAHALPAAPVHARAGRPARAC